MRTAQHRATRSATQWRRIQIALVAFVGSCLTVLSIQHSPHALATTTAFNAAGDTFVASDLPANNYGTATKIYTDGSPVRRIYLHFVVSGVGTSATGATLKVYANSGSTAGIDVATLTSGTWSEASTTWSNDTTTWSAPVATGGTITAASWVSIPLPSGLVTGDGAYDLALIPRSAQAISWASRESGNAPQLELTTADAAPLPGSPPVISDVDHGTTLYADGDLLQTTAGSWNPDGSYAYQWQRCTSATGCADISGATAATYRIGTTSTEAGNTLQVVVTASNTAGHATQTATATPAVVASQPRNTVAPSITGAATVGTQLTGSTGTWYGTPTITYAYQWVSCGSTCANVGTGPTYTIQPGDSGHTIKLTVTASNPQGPVALTSTPTAPVGGAVTYPVIAAAGDIACDPANSNFNGGAGANRNCYQRAVSDLLYNKGDSAVLPLGDNQYYCGSLAAFQRSYDLSWGRVKSTTHPVVGNHEYLTSGGTTGSTGCDSTNANAAGYWSYFGAAANPLGTSAHGWYSYDVGSWHLIALNSNCGNVGGCTASTPEGKWLSADLAAHHNQCTLAYWHIPLFSSGGRAASNSQWFWSALYNAGADVVLNGHDHIYERFDPQNPSGVLDTARGIREFIAGTGGANHTSIATIAANSVVRDTSTFGVLRLTLKDSSYDWKFVPAAGTGSFTDSGSGSCH